MSDSQEIDKIFDVDNGENIDGNVEEMQHRIERENKLSCSFASMIFYLIRRTEIKYRLGTVTTDLFSNWLSHFQMDYCLISIYDKNISGIIFILLL